MAMGSRNEQHGRADDNTSIKMSLKNKGGEIRRSMASKPEDRSGSVVMSVV